MKQNDKLLEAFELSIQLAMTNGNKKAAEIRDILRELVKDEMSVGQLTVSAPNRANVHNGITCTGTTWTPNGSGLK